MSTPPRSPPSSRARSPRGRSRRNWAFIDEVPKTTVGKFDKKVLRAEFAGGDFEVLRTKD